MATKQFLAGVTALGASFLSISGKFKVSVDGCGSVKRFRVDDVALVVQRAGGSCPTERSRPVMLCAIVCLCSAVRHTYVT